jgi:hypothetical protein
MILLLLVVTSVVPLFILIYTAWLFHSRGWPVCAALLWLTVLHEAVLVVYPIFHSSFTDFELDSVVYAGPSDLLLVMAGEALFVSLFCITLLVGLRISATAQDVYHLPEFSTQLLYILVVSELVVSAYNFASPVPDYQIAMHHAEYSPTSIMEMLAAWIRGAVERPGIVASSVVVTGVSYSRTLRLAAVAALSLLVLSGLSEGVRGRSTWVVCMLLVMSVIRRSWKPAVVSACILAIVAPFSVFLAGPYRSILYQMHENTGRLEALDDLYQTAGGNDGESSDETVAHNLARRAQGPRNSVVLMRLHDSGSGGSYKPILSALYTPIPRILWPDKPPAGSTTNTNYGSAIFLVRRLGYNAPLYNMGPILASGHAYWEGGWFWLVGCAILTGGIWYNILSWCRRKFPDDLGTTLAITFCAALPIDGLYTMLNPLYAMIALFWTAILPVLLIRWAFLRMQNLRNAVYVVPASREVALKKQV